MPPSVVAAQKSCPTCGMPSTASAAIRDRTTVARCVVVEYTTVMASRSRLSSGMFTNTTSSRTATASYGSVPSAPRPDQVTAIASNVNESVEPSSRASASAVPDSEAFGSRKVSMPAANSS